MWVIDELTGEKCDYGDTMIVLIKEVRGISIYGYTNQKHKCVALWTRDNCIRPVIKDNFKGKIFFSKRRGIYMLKDQFNPIEMQNEMQEYGRGTFPYLIEREYEAVFNFSTFKDKQVVLHPATFEPELSYTFGLEFETACGYVPEDLCYRDGLIPLRDGSISGIEYSTVVLEGNEGLSLLRQQLITLREYTRTDMDCSLHVHLGGFPLEPDKIFKVYQLCLRLEDDIRNYTPKYVFDTHEYKSSGKDYCKCLPVYPDFYEMYMDMVGMPFYGDLTQKHPEDVERRAKWNIDSRYYFVNFINILCYDVNKTIEFRFLKPTYSFNKILTWLYIFNAILYYAEHNDDMEEIDTIEMLIDKVYPNCEFIHEGLDKLRKIAAHQRKIGDFCGYNNLNLFSDDSAE